MVIRVLIALIVGFGLGLVAGRITLPTEAERQVEAYVAARCVTETDALAQARRETNGSIPLLAIFGASDCREKARTWAWRTILNRGLR